MSDKDPNIIRQPDPCAIMEYLANFDGMTGAQIVEQLGGIEFMQDKLADTLKVESVKIVPKAAE